MSEQTAITLPQPLKPDRVVYIQKASSFLWVSCCFWNSQLLTNFPHVCNSMVNLPCFQILTPDQGKLASNLCLPFHSIPFLSFFLLFFFKHGMVVTLPHAWWKSIVCWLFYPLWCWLLFLLIKQPCLECTGLAPLVPCGIVCHLTTVFKTMKFSVSNSVGCFWEILSLHHLQAESTALYCLFPESLTCFLLFSSVGIDEDREDIVRTEFFKSPFYASCLSSMIV